LCRLVHNVALSPIWCIVVYNNRSPLRSYGSRKLRITLANCSRTVYFVSLETKRLSRRTRRKPISANKDLPIRGRSLRNEELTSIIYDVSLYLRRVDSRELNKNTQKLRPTDPIVVELKKHPRSSRSNFVASRHVDCHRIR